jgi:uncharacterized membrane protein YdbT with pleckstrin-like domain
LGRKTETSQQKIEGKSTLHNTYLYMYMLVILMILYLITSGAEGITDWVEIKYWMKEDIIIRCILGKHVYTCICLIS